MSFRIEAEKVLVDYRIRADMAYSEVTDGVHTKEEYHGALRRLGEMCSKDIEKIVEKYYIPKPQEDKSQLLLNTLISIINPKEKPTADRLRKLNARRKEYTDEEITEAAKTFSQSEWHKENRQMSIDNLLAPSKFGRWFAQSNTNKGKRKFD